MKWQLFYYVTEVVVSCHHLTVIFDNDDKKDNKNKVQNKYQSIFNLCTKLKNTQNSKAKFIICPFLNYDWLYLCNFFIKHIII